MTSVLDGTGLVAAHLTTIATVEFTNRTAAGSTGCNLYQARYSVDGDSITFGDLALTGFACDPDYVGQSDVFVRAMQASTRVVIIAESLELTNATGVVHLRFRAAGELPLVGVAWRLASYGGGTSPLDGTQISLAFRTDGTLGGIAGCNEYLADYRIDGDRLVIGAIARTESEKWRV
jgi:heat shock protein HslJ